MGGCAGRQRDPKIEILTKAHRTFTLLDKNKKNNINASDIEYHFGSYAAASANIMLRQIDLDANGIITKNDWLGYWELVRRAGYRESQIIRQLNNIDEGKLTLNFPNVNKYKQELPRSTVVGTIVDDLKRTPPQQLPFSLQK